MRTPFSRAIPSKAFQMNELRWRETAALLMVRRRSHHSPVESPNPRTPYAQGSAPDGVHAELGEPVVERARERGGDHLLAVGERVLVVRVLHQQEEDVGCREISVRYWCRRARRARAAACRASRVGTIASTTWSAPQCPTAR